MPLEFKKLWSDITCGRSPSRPFDVVFRELWRLHVEKKLGESPTFLEFKAAEETFIEAFLRESGVDGPAVQVLMTTLPGTASPIVSAIENRYESRVFVMKSQMDIEKAKQMQEGGAEVERQRKRANAAAEDVRRLQREMSVLQRRATDAEMATALAREEAAVLRCRLADAEWNAEQTAKAQRAHIASLEKERDALAADRHGLEQRCTAAEEAVELLQAECGALRLEREQAEDAVRSLASFRGDVTDERDRLVADSARLILEKDLALAQLARATENMRRAQEAAGKAAAERDTLALEVRRVAEERDRVASDRTRIASERDAMARERASLLAPSPVHPPMDLAHNQEELQAERKALLERLSKRSMPLRASDESLGQSLGMSSRGSQQQLAPPTWRGGPDEDVLLASPGRESPASGRQAASRDEGGPEAKLPGSAFCWVEGTPGAPKLSPRDPGLAARGPQLQASPPQPSPGGPPPPIRSQSPEVAPLMTPEVAPLMTPGRASGHDAGLEGEEAQPRALLDYFAKMRTLEGRLQSTIEENSRLQRAVSSLVSEASGAAPAASFAPVSPPAGPPLAAAPPQPLSLGSVVAPQPLASRPSGPAAPAPAPPLLAPRSALAAASAPADAPLMSPRRSDPAPVPAPAAPATGSEAPLLAPRRSNLAAKAAAAVAAVASATAQPASAPSGTPLRTPVGVPPSRRAAAAAAARTPATPATPASAPGPMRTPPTSGRAIAALNAAQASPAAPATPLLPPAAAGPSSLPHTPASSAGGTPLMSPRTTGGGPPPQRSAGPGEVTTPRGRSSISGLKALAAELESSRSRPSPLMSAARGVFGEADQAPLAPPAPREPEPGQDAPRTPLAGPSPGPDSGSGRRLHDYVPGS